MKFLDFDRQPPSFAKVRTFIVTGSEELLVELARKRIAGGLPAGLEEVDLTPGEKETLEAAVLFDELRMRSLFAPDRLIVVRRADQCLKDDLKRVASFVAKGAFENRLLLIGAALTKKKGRQLSFAPGIEEMLEAGALLVECDPLYDAPYGNTRPRYDSPLSAFLAEETRKRGREMSLETAFALHSAVGNELRALVSEIEKLILYVGDRRTITEADVAAGVLGRRSPAVWDFCDALAARNRRASLGALETLFKQGTEDAQGKRITDKQSIAMMTLGALQSRMRRIAEALYRVRRGSSVDDAVASLGLPAFMARGLPDQVRAYAALTPAQILERLVFLERDLKTGEGDPELLFLGFTAGITGGAS